MTVAVQGRRWPSRPGRDDRGLSGIEDEIFRHGLALDLVFLKDAGGGISGFTVNGMYTAREKKINVRGRAVGPCFQRLGAAGSTNRPAGFRRGRRFGDARRAGPSPPEIPPIFRT